MFDILNVPELGNLEIVEIYDYHNMPILFSCQNSAAQLYMVFFADYFPEYEMWLYAEVSPMRFKRIRSGEINLYDTFREPEMKRLLKAMFSHETPAELINSQYIHPNQLDNDVFLPVSKYLNIKNIRFSPRVDLPENPRLSGRNVIGVNFKSVEEYNAEAPAFKLGNFLTTFQNTMNVIEMDRLKYPQVTPDIRDKMQFYTLAFQPGSFDIKLASKKEDTTQMALFETDSEQKEAITYFFNLLKSKTNKSDLKDILTSLGLRTTNEYRKLLISLNKLETDVTLSWTSPKTNADEVVTLSRDEIPELVDALKVIEEEQEMPFEVTGHLIGLSLTTKRFEIETDDEPIKGYTQKDANHNIKNATLSRRYKALIKEVVKRNETTNEIVKTEHILLNLEEV